MARPTDKLTAVAVKSERRPGRYGDGGGLWLQVQAADRKSWLFRYSFKKRAREMGLGPYPAVGLADARNRARAQRAVLRAGMDPLEAKRGAGDGATRDAMTFSMAVERLVAVKRPGWRNTKHADQWKNTLAKYAGPVVGRKAARDVTLDDVLAILKPIWSAKHETASRLRGRIEDVLWFAAVTEERQGGYRNPAVWKGNLSHLLPKPRHVRRVVPHVALPWQQSPAFMARLRAARGVGARALEWTILNAARSNMTIGATWDEVDVAARKWVVPGHRMKSGGELNVPLSPAAIAVLEAVRPLRRPEHGDFIFPGQKRGRPISNMTMAKVVARLQAEADVHGFRSSFRDWAGEETQHASDVAEAALDHQLPGGKTRAAYQRGDLLRKRDALMADWAEYLTASGARDPASIGTAA